MSIVKKAALTAVICAGALLPAGFAATNSAFTPLPAKKLQPRMVMRSKFNEFTQLVDSVTVNDDPLVHTAQILAWGAGDDILGKDDAAAQAEQVMKNLLVAIHAAGGTANGIIKINVYLARPDVLPAVREAFTHRMGQFGQSALSFVTCDLTHPDALVAMDAVVLTDRDYQQVIRVRASSLFGLKGAAAAVLPAGGKYYISGQAKIGPLPEALTNTLASLQSTLTFLGLEKSNVVQLKAFMQSITAADSVRAGVSNFFAPDMAPPMVFVSGITSTNTPIEIELIAADNKPPEATGDSIEYLTPPELTVSKVFSRVAHVKHGRMVYFSALYGNSSGPARSQLNDIYVYLDSILPRSGTDFDHLVKATYYVTDDDASNQLNEIRPKFYNPLRPPAASKATVKGAGFPDRTVAVDLIGVSR